MKIIKLIDKKEEPKRIITEHPELRWWWNAITVRAHNMNAVMQSGSNFLWDARPSWGKSK